MTTDVSRMLADEAAASEAAASVDTPMIRNRARAKEPSQVYSLRIPVDRLEELRQRAERQQLAPTVLLRRWILERLDEETDSESRLEEQRDALIKEHADDALMVVTRSELVSLIASTVRELTNPASNGQRDTDKGRHARAEAG